MKNDFLTPVLERYKSSLKNDFDAYNNHINRVFNYCVLLDSELKHHPKYAIAVVFHDLGIWTENTFDYLEASKELAKSHLISINKENWTEEILLMIDMHHKRSEYTGKFEETVEVFRKADWIDVSLGLINHGIPNTKIKTLNKQFPNAGFHKFLAAQTLKRLVTNPFNLLPMFKK